MTELKDMDSEDQLNFNNYASKKTLAQGFMDIALFTNNAQQLKYILQVGDSHPFYQMLLILIITSMTLQVIDVCVCVFLGLRWDIQNNNHRMKAKFWNNFVLVLIGLDTYISILINTFEMKEKFSLSEIEE